MDVSLEPEDEVWVAKISAETVEVNLRSELSALIALDQVRAASWSTKSSIQAGSCAGLPVFWCSEGEKATMLIGRDDETWDIALEVPLSVVDEIVGLARSADETR